MSSVFLNCPEKDLEEQFDKPKSQVIAEWVTYFTDPLMQCCTVAINSNTDEKTGYCSAHMAMKHIMCLAEKKKKTRRFHIDGKVRCLEAHALYRHFELARVKPD